MPSGISEGTDLALYADDTKIWRKILSESDHEALQNDISYLHNWSIANKMSFHPHKCKVVSIANRLPPLLGIMPNIQYYYDLGEVTLDYADNERDLGVDINLKLNFNDQCERLYSKANQQFGLTKRTCYFVNDIKRKRALYLSLIRSQFEHCSPVWRPTGKTMIDKLENLQKRCIKWILSEEWLRYNNYITYIRKCRQVRLLPLSKRFDFNDLVLFFKVIRNLIPLDLPSYLQFYNGNSRLRSCHFDNLSIISSLSPKCNGLSDTNNNCALNRSFFYRAHLQWNLLPLEIRSLERLSMFRSEVMKFLWKSILTDIDEILESDEEDLFDGT